MELTYLTDRIALVSLNDRKMFILAKAHWSGYPDYNFSTGDSIDEHLIENVTEIGLGKDAIYGYHRPISQTAAGRDGFRYFRIDLPEISVEEEANPEHNTSLMLPSALLDIYKKKSGSQ